MPAIEGEQPLRGSAHLQFAEAHSNLGNAYLELGEPEKAAASY